MKRSLTAPCVDTGGLRRDARNPQSTTRPGAAGIRNPKSLALVLLLLAFPPRPITGQTADADKARAVLDGAIQALGGEAFLKARDLREEGRAFQFGREEELQGMARFVAYEKFPDRERQELGRDKEVIFVLNDGRAWEKDMHGVLALPDSEIERIRYNRLLSIEDILRHRLNEPGVLLRYAGTDVVGGRRVDLVEFEDSNNRLVTIAVEQDSHLPVRRHYTRRNPRDNLKDVEVETLGSYRRVGSIAYPFYRMRQRNGEKIFEVFVNTAAFNQNLPDALFERPPGPERVPPGAKKK
jgi:hypothetical protein